MPKKHTMSKAMRKTGSCGHTKGPWDNHHKCLVCAKCTRSNTCETCCVWTPATWKMAESRTSVPVRTGKKDPDLGLSSSSSVSGRGSLAPMQGDSRSVSEVTGPVLTKASGPSDTYTTQAESPSKKRLRSVSGDLGTTVVADLVGNGRQSAQRADTSLARCAPDAIPRHSGDLVDHTRTPMINQPVLAVNRTVSGKFLVENQVSSKNILKKVQSPSRDSILKEAELPSRNKIPDRNLASNIDEIYVDEHCSFSDHSSVSVYGYRNYLSNAQSTILDQPNSGPSYVSFSVPSRIKQLQSDIDMHPNDKQVITRIYYDQLPVSGHRSRADEQQSVSGPVNNFPATVTATDAYRLANTGELSNIRQNQCRTSDNRSISGTLGNRSACESTMATGPVTGNRTLNPPNYRYSERLACNPTDVQLPDGNFESYRPTNAYGSPVYNRQAYIDRNRGRIHELPSYNHTNDRRSMFDEQGRSLMVHRSYNYPNSNVAYSEPPKRINSLSPPRTQRMLDIRDPFEEQYTRAHTMQPITDAHKRTGTHQRTGAHLRTSVHLRTDTHQHMSEHQSMSAHQRTTAHQRTATGTDPVRIPRNTSVPRDESINRVDDYHPDQVSLLAPTQDLIYNSDYEDTRRAEEAHVNNSVVLPTPDPSTHDHYEGNDTSEEESSITDPVPDQWSMEKAVNEVFRVLPATLCPRVPTMPKHKNRSGLEELNNEEVPIPESLPQANLVRSMLVQLQSSRSEEACSNGWIVPPSMHREAIASRMYVRYASSLEHFPVRTPAIDSDASSIGLNNPTSVSVPTKLLEKWETRARMGVNVASHSDHFTVTLSQLLKDENVSCLAIDRIMAALDKSKTTLLALNLQNATEMLSLRRDATLDCRSTSLLPGSKDMLRAAPLSAKTLFDGKVKAVATADLAEQTRLCSAHVFASNRKRSAPSSNFKKSDKGGNHKAKKAKVTFPVKQNENKNVPFKKSYPNKFRGN